MTKALTGRLVEYCDPDVRRQLWRIPSVPTGVTDVNFDYSGDIGDKSVEVTCRYDMYGTMGPQKHYHCCLFAETTYDVDDAYFEDTRIGLYGSVQLAPNAVLTTSITAQPFEEDGRTSAQIGIFAGF